MYNGVVATSADIPIIVRPYEPRDHAACKALYLQGLVGGAKLAENDMGLDIDDIEQVYAAPAGNAFWVAENEAGEVVGMIGVQQLDEGVGEIRRLRVRVDSQRRGIGSQLLHAAIGFCQEMGYLKVALSTGVGTLPAVKLFEKFHFRHDRTRMVAGKEMLYFWLDFYARDADPRNGDAPA